MTRYKRYKANQNLVKRKADTFIALWTDNNGNGTFGILNGPCKTKEAAILEVLKDIEINNYVDPINLDQCKLDLINYSELNIPSFINYKIESI